MRITDDVISRTAQLAALTFTDEENAGLREELDRFIGYADILAELDAAGSESGCEQTLAAQDCRADEAAESFPRGEILRNAPERTDEYFVVPASF